MECEIVKIMNNNVLWVKEIDNTLETVIIGRGIGFGMKAGQRAEIEDEKIEKTFKAYDNKIVREYIHLAETINPRIMEICTEIIISAEKKLGKLSSRVYIVLSDHIAFAIERIKMNMLIENPFLYEIKTLYKDEFELGLKAQEEIFNKIGIDISEDEVGFIAMHLNAARENIEVKEKLKNTRLIKSVVHIIEQEMDYSIREDELLFFRLTSHIKASIDRMMKGIAIKNPLLDSIRKEMKESFEIAEKVKDEVGKFLGIKVSDDELGFIAIHIARIKNVINEQKSV